MQIIKSKTKDLRSHSVNKKNNKKKLFAYVLLAIMFCSIFILPISADDDNYEVDTKTNSQGQITQIKITIERKLLPDKTITVKDRNGDKIVTRADIDDYARDNLPAFKYSIYKSTSSAEAGCGEILLGVADFCNSKSLASVVEFDGMSWVETIQDALIFTGRLICFVYFLLALLDAATKDSFTLEIFVKTFAKLIILFVLLDKNTLTTITNFGSALETQLLSSISTTVEDKLSEVNLGALLYYVHKINNTNWLKCIGFVFENLLPSVTLLAVTIIAFVIALGRTIELLVYQTFLPIGVAPIYNGGLNSSGFKYIKKIIALYLQGVIMFVAAVMGALFAFNSTKFVNGNFFSSSVSATIIAPVLDLVIAIVTVMIMVRSKKIAEDVVGV